MVGRKAGYPCNSVARAPSGLGRGGASSSGMKPAEVRDDWSFEAMVGPSFGKDVEGLIGMVESGGQNAKDAAVQLKFKMGRDEELVARLCARGGKCAALVEDFRQKNTAKQAGSPSRGFRR